MNGYIVQEDGHGDLWIWVGDRTNAVGVLSQRDVRDRHLWEAIVALVEGRPA